MPGAAASVPSSMRISPETGKRRLGPSARAAERRRPVGACVVSARWFDSPALRDESRGSCPGLRVSTRDARTYGSELGQVPIACEFNCPNAPVDTPGLLPDTNGDTWGVWKLMPGFPGPSGSPTAAELSGEHSL